MPVQKRILEKIFSNLEFIQTKRKGWQARLISKIGGVLPNTEDPLNSILILVEKLGCRSIILERGYVDINYLAEYSYFYSRSFREYTSPTVRLHFWAEPINYNNIENLSNKKYLGYSIVRPIRSFRTSRTVLKSPYDNRDSKYTLCKTDFHVNLSGNQLKITGMPFIQQDTNVNVCAQAALWMVALYMYQKYSYPRHTPPEITKFATQYITVGPIRTGLTSEQMLFALRAMGYQPIKFTHYSVEWTVMMIYAYIESEIPVILALQLGLREFHAITVIGHDYKVKKPFFGSTTANLIECFYYHDDAKGPYKKLMIKKDKVKKSIEEHVREVMVPGLVGVTMQADDVMSHIYVLLQVKFFNALITLFGSRAEKLAFSKNEISDLIFRFYLRQSNTFKNNLSKEMDEPFKREYRAMRMPRYVWVVELSKKELVTHPSSADRKMVGEIVIDSTADWHAYFESYLSIHLLGRMFIKKPEAQVPFKLLFYPEKPYSHLVR